MFIYVNIFAFVLDRVLPFQNPMKMIDKDAQGLEQPNSSLGRNLELHDEVMQPCMENFPSYKNVVTCKRREECVLQSDQEPLEEFFWESMRNMKGLRIEKKIGEYECPEIILSPKEETRISRPWKNGVIVKMLGKRIGYKALEAKLQQLWARKGIINIMDLGQDFFLVTFTCE